MPARKKEPMSEEIEVFLQKKKPHTQETYRAALRLFEAFYQERHAKNGIRDFLKAIHEDIRKPAVDQQRLAETEIDAFIEHLRNLRTKMHPEGVSSSSIRVYVAAIQNMLKYYHLPFSLSFVNLPEDAPQKNNKKQEWDLESVKRFFEQATNFRDKALILCMFQSGLGVAEICSLNYEDLKEEFEKKVLPLCLRITRQKTSQEYRTFLGRDAVKYSQLYLETRPNIKDSDPLFTMGGSGIRGRRSFTNEIRISESAVQAAFRKIASKCDFVHKKCNGYNPARPHSLRAAFRSRLTGKMDSDLIEYFMGHKLPKQKSAYINIPTEDLRELYANYEHLLSVEKTSKDEYSTATDEGKQYSELKAQVRNLQTTIGDLTANLAAQQRLIEHFYEATGIDPEILQKHMLKAKQESLQKQDAERQEEEEKEKVQIEKQLSKK